MKELTKSDLEGSVIQAKKKLWKGSLRTKDDHRTVWVCKHNHSRLEFNRRYEVPDTEQPKDESGEHPTVFKVWEASALNCGRMAYRQYGTSKPVGWVGDVGDPHVPYGLRPDTRFARVGDEVYLGQVELNSNGHRLLTVKDWMEGMVSSVTARLNLDVAPKKGLTLPDVASDQALRLVTALWLLKGGIWGVVFQDHAIAMNAEGISRWAVDELLGKEEEPVNRKSRKLVLPKSQFTKYPKGEPRIETNEADGKRVYEVVNADGLVDSSWFQRGRAAAALKALT
jgi:hypothetical protein